MMLIIIIIAILILCMTITTCAYLKTHEARRIVFKNSGYEKRIERLEKEMEDIKRSEK